MMPIYAAVPIVLTACVVAGIGLLTLYERAYLNGSADGYDEGRRDGWLEGFEDGKKDIE